MNTKSYADNGATAPANACHDDDEARLDAAIVESFPASDPISVAQPGSLVGERNATSGAAERFAAAATGAALAILVVTALRAVAGPPMTVAPPS